jgi:hypothetical protein
MLTKLMVKLTLIPPTNRKQPPTSNKQFPILQAKPAKSNIIEHDVGIAD